MGVAPLQHSLHTRIDIQVPAANATCAEDNKPCITLTIDQAIVAKVVFADVALEARVRVTRHAMIMWIAGP